MIPQQIGGIFMQIRPGGMVRLPQQPVLQRLPQQQVLQQQQPQLQQQQQQVRVLQQVRVQQQHYNYENIT